MKEVQVAWHLLREKKSSAKKSVIDPEGYVIRTKPGITETGWHGADSL